MLAAVLGEESSRVNPVPFRAIDPTASALGDPRRARRLADLVATLATRPGARPAAASGSWAATKAAYRFWDAAGVTPEAIRAAHVATTRERVAAQEGRVLAIQDTTELDATDRPATTGVGPLAHPARRGRLVQSVLAASPDGVPLGLLDQQVWARETTETGKRHRRRRRGTADKESQRWLDGQGATHAALPAGTPVVTVADREAGSYDLFAAPRPVGSDLPIRAAHDRRVTSAAATGTADEATAEAASLWATARAAAPLGQRTVTVPRADERPPREATLTVRAAPLALCPPRHHRQRAAVPPVPVVAVVAVLAEEAAPPADATSICWLRVTTLPVAALADAERCLDWYASRWLIERYHFVLKSGCKVEELQLQTAARLERALATSSVVAVRVLWLTHLARAAPDASCAVALRRPEWEALACAIHRTPTPPHDPPSLRQAVRWIAQLGGFLGRRHDGEPGVRAVWRGLRRLDDLTTLWTLLHPDPPPLTSGPRLVGNG